MSLQVKYRLLLIIGFLLLRAYCLEAQNYRVYSYRGAVEIKDKAGRGKALQLDATLDGTDRVNVPSGGSLAIIDEVQGRVSLQGEGRDILVADIVADPGKHLLGRIVSMLKGTDMTERAYVSKKGDDPIPEFIFAINTPTYKPALRLSFELVSYESGRMVEGPLREGQRISFRVTNHEDFPLCIGIMWIDSSGNQVDCLADEDRYVILPGKTTVWLSENVMEVAPPFGTDSIYLLASTELFDLKGLIVNYGQSASVSESTGIPIGFVRKRILIRD